MDMLYFVFLAKDDVSNCQSIRIGKNESGRKWHEYHGRSRQSVSRRFLTLAKCLLANFDWILRFRIPLTNIFELVHLLK